MKALFISICIAVALFISFTVENELSDKAEIAALNAQITTFQTELAVSTTKIHTLQATLNACAARHPALKAKNLTRTSTPTIFGWPVHK